MKTSSPEQPKSPSPLKILLMGPPGSRKTTFMLQFPKLHVLDCDQNLDGPEAVLRFGRKDVSGKQVLAPLKPDLSYTYDSIRYDDSGKALDIDDCYNRVIDKLRLFSTDPLYKARETVAIDSLSHVNEFIIRHVLKIQNKTRKTYEMEARDWSPFKAFAYQLLVARLEECARTSICVCHELKMTEADKENIMAAKVVGYEPYFQGKLGDILGAFFTDVWRMEVRPGPAGSTETWMQTSRHAKCDVLKNSLGMPPELNVTAGYSVIEPYIKSRIEAIKPT